MRSINLHFTYLLTIIKRKHAAKSVHMQAKTQSIALTSFVSLLWTFSFSACMPLRYTSNCQCRRWRRRWLHSPGDGAGYRIVAEWTTEVRHTHGQCTISLMLMRVGWCRWCITVSLRFKHTTHNGSVQHLTTYYGSHITVHAEDQLGRRQEFIDNRRQNCTSKRNR